MAVLKSEGSKVGDKKDWSFSSLKTTIILSALGLQSILNR